jgi:hypothetical protein
MHGGDVIISRSLVDAVSNDDAVGCIRITIVYNILCSHIGSSVCTQYIQSRDISVGIALGNGLDDRSSRFRFPEGARNFSLHHRAQNDSGAHPASYPMGTRSSLPGGKVVVA